MCLSVEVENEEEIKRSFRGPKVPLLCYEKAVPSSGH
jgi:hypothetical protein